MSGLSFSIADYPAACMLALGTASLLLRRRMPAGLGLSLALAAWTAGLVVAALLHRGPALAHGHALLRVTSALCAQWAAAGAILHRMGIGRRRTPKEDAAHVFFAWSLVCGVVVAVLALDMLITHSWIRVLDPTGLTDRPASEDGLLVLMALIAAAILWTASRTQPEQPVILLVLCAMFVWWSSLMIPVSVGTFEGFLQERHRLLPSWWNWVFQLQLGLAAVLSLGVTVQEVRYRSRRAAALPNHLDHLLEPYSRWSAFTQTEAVVGGVILVLGVYQIVRAGPPSLSLWLCASVVSAAAGIACLFLSYRRWSPNTTGLGMALLSLAAVSLACAAADLLRPSGPRLEYASRLPVLLNAALFALVMMIAWWRWLGRLWHQQLLDGSAWTTTGRMIPYVRRTVFLLSALAVLAAFEMALWPRLISASDDDASVGRVVCGAAVIFLLAVLTARHARRDDAPTTASLSVGLALAGAVFILIRMSFARGWIEQHLAVVLSAAALPVLLAAELLPRTRWRCFAVPLWTIALLVLPAGALGQLLGVKSQPAEWVRPMTLAILGALFSFAGSREHRRAFLVLGGVLLLAALAGLYRSYGTISFPGHTS